MPTQIYKTSDGKRVPGVTTVLGNIGWNRRPLMIWANRLGLDGVDLDSPDAKKAADVGTEAHLLGQQWLEAGCPEVVRVVETEAQRAFQSLPVWWRQQKLKVLHTELSLVSQTYRYGGTMDLVAQDEAGRVHIIDFKTGKDVYKEMLLQLAAYGHLYQENHGPVEMVYSLLRWGRQGDFHHHHYTNLNLAWEGFEHALCLHKIHHELRD